MTKASFDLKTYPMTVVIATLGGDTLKGTIETINKGTIVPDEILICIPGNEAYKVQNLSFQNVKVLVTSCRGQVVQRVTGFQNVSHDIVMQLDDDMLVNEYCIEYLLETLNKSGVKVAVAPALMDLVTGESVYKKPGQNSVFQNIYYWLMNGADGYRPGQIDKAGAGVGIDPEGEGKKQFDVEWLAGGCVMHYRENLVMENYYPFTGKAYFEDVVHSFYLREKGVNLIVDSRAICWLESEPYSKYGLIEFFKYLVSDYKDRKYTVRLYSRSLFRMHCYYLIRFLNYIFKKIFGSVA
jgi:glycosyltransferase involved in cell wall biosynthesis